MSEHITESEFYEAHKDTIFTLLDHQLDHTLSTEQIIADGQSAIDRTFRVARNDDNVCIYNEDDQFVIMTNYITQY